MKRQTIALCALVIAMMLGSCASKKNMVKDGKETVSQTSQDAQSGKLQTELALKRVLDNMVQARNIVADMSFNIKMGSQDITVPGSLHMRRDEVIRIQLFIPLLGTEVGRLEFTPNSVLVIDRMHKEYVEGDYTQLDFLKKNGLNFYSLQALFWNELLVPGQKTVGVKDAARFEVDAKRVKLTNGNMTYNWTTLPETDQIVMTNVGYASSESGASSLLWQYSDFRQLGTKQYPVSQTFQFTTTATKQQRMVRVTLDMETPRDKGDWDVRTTVSSKYKKVNAADVLGKLLSF